MQWLRRRLGVTITEPPTSESPSVVKSREVRQETKARAYLIDRRADAHISAVCQVAEDVEQGRQPDVAAVLRESGSLLADRLGRRATTPRRED